MRYILLMAFISGSLFLIAGSNANPDLYFLFAGKEAMYLSKSPPYSSPSIDAQCFAIEPRGIYILRSRSLSSIAENAFLFKASMTLYFWFLSFKSIPSDFAASSIIESGYRALLENLKILPILEIGLANKLVSAILIPLSPNA